MKPATFVEMQERQQRSSDPPASSRLAPDQTGLLSLQRSAGNAAVTSALLSRQPDQTDAALPESDEAAELPVLDPETEQMLNRLFPRQQAATYEVIGGSTGAQSIGNKSGGELTTGALVLWRREHINLDDAYRQSADRSHGRGGNTVEPTRGGGAGTAAGEHWGMLFAAWDYRNRQGRATGEIDIPGVEALARLGNLADVRSMVRRGSPYRRAAEASYDRHDIVENPSASEMFNRVLDAINELDRAGGGQLTVNFQGHGGRGAIDGVDGEVIDRTTLLTLGRMASEQGVHLTFILDTCNVGSAALLAENQEMVNVTEASEHTSPQTQAAIRAMGRPLRTLMDIGLRLNDLATDLRSQRVRNNAERVMARETMTRARTILSELTELSQSHPEISGLVNLRIRALSPDIAFLVLLGRPSVRRRDLLRARESLAPLLDELNFVMDTGVAGLQAIVEADSP